MLLATAIRPRWTEVKKTLITFIVNIQNKCKIKLSLKTNITGQSACHERNGLIQGRPAQADAAAHRRWAAMGKSGFAAPSARIGSPRPAPRPTSGYKYNVAPRIFSFLARYSANARVSRRDNYY